MLSINKKNGSSKICQSSFEIVIKKMVIENSWKFLATKNVKKTKNETQSLSNC